MTVKNMCSPSSGRPVENQFEIHDDNGNVFFQSYSTMIIKIDRQGKTYLDKHSWDCSKTTGKYRNNFLGEDKRTTERKIQSGEYKLVDLNDRD